MNHVCNLKLSSATIKIRKKSVEWILITFYLTQYNQNIIITTCSQHKNMNVIFLYSFFILSSEIQYTFYIYSSSQTGLATFPFSVVTRG